MVLSVHSDRITELLDPSAMFTSFNARAIGLTLDAESTLAAAASAGFGGVDLLVRDLLMAGHEPRSLRRRMDDLGLRGGAWPLPVAWRGTEAEFTRDLAQLPVYAAAAAELGLFRTATWVMAETPDRMTSPAETFERHVERLTAIGRVLHEHGTSLGLEVIGVESFRTGRGEPFITNMAELDPLLRTLVDLVPSVGVLVDTFHLCAAGETIDSALRWGVERVVWVHAAEPPAKAARNRALIRDAERGLPGEYGTAPIRAWLQQLAEAGYDGPVTAEPLASSRALAGLGAAEAAVRVARALQSVWPQP